MGQLDSHASAYEQALRNSESCMDILPTQRPSDWVRKVMREARKNGR